MLNNDITKKVMLCIKFVVDTNIEMKRKYYL